MTPLKRVAISSGQIKEVDDDLIDLEIHDPKTLFGSHVNLIPLQNSVAAPRLFYGARFVNQAVPLVQPEEALVQNLEDEKLNRSFDDLFGKQSGALFADDDGEVVDIGDDHITVRYADGSDKKFDLYNNFSFNRYTYLHNTPLVKPGDKVTKGQILAKSNFTNDKGTLSLGVNARVGLVPYKGFSIDDSIVISESFAKRLTSDHMFSHVEDYKRGLKKGKNHFKSIFPDKFTNEQLDKLDDDGFVKPGVVLNYGDPITLATSPKVISSNNMMLGKMQKNLKNVRNDETSLWEFQNQGFVTDVEKTKNGVKVNIKSAFPAKVGDKMVFRPGQKCYDVHTELLTENEGWVPIANVTTEHKVACLLQISGRSKGVIGFRKPLATISYDYAGEMYGYKDNTVDYLVTPNHRVYVKKYKELSRLCLDASFVHGRSGVYVETAVPFEDDVSASTNIKLNNGFHVKRSSFIAFLALYISSLRDSVLDPKGFSIPLSEIDNTDDILRVISDIGIPESSIEKIKKDNCLNVLFPDGIYDLLYGVIEQMNWSYVFTSELDAFVFTHHMDLFKKKINKNYSLLEVRSTSQADLVQYVYNRIGNITYSSSKNLSSGVTVYTIRIPLTNYKSHALSTRKFYKQRYYGNVYCVQVPEPGVLLTRRNKKIMLNGNSIISKILPDNEMLRDESGKPLEVLLNHLSIPSRVNNSMVYELLLGKIAAKEGKPMKLPSFLKDKGKWHNYVKNLLQEKGVKDTERVFDPVGQLELENPITVGNAYVLKLQHMSEMKYSERGLGAYTQDDLPLKGGDESAQSKRLSGLEGSALLSSGAYNVLRDMATVRGTKNDEYWRAIRSGEAPPDPKHPFIWDKFNALIFGSGMATREKGNGVLQLTPYTDRFLEELNPVEIKHGEIVDHELRGIKGGLFDEQLTLRNSWGKITLPVKLPNPAFQPVIQKLIEVKGSDFTDILSGKKELNGMTGPKAIGAALDAIDIDTKMAELVDLIKTGSKTKRNNYIKQYSYLKGLKNSGIKPSELMISAVPVLPPRFRPFTQIEETFIPGSANELYKELFTINNTYKRTKELLGDYGASSSLVDVYKAVGAVMGHNEPVGEELKRREVSGFFKQVVGTNPKLSTFQSKMIAKPVDLTGRSVIGVDPDLTIDQIGIPETMAWKMYSPFIQRRLVQMGFPPSVAIKSLNDKTPEARNALLAEIKERPVIYSRAPAWHKYNSLGGWPVLLEGDAIKINPLTASGLNADYDGDANLNQLLVLTDVDTYASLSLKNKFNTINSMKIKNTNILVKDNEVVFITDLEDFPRIENSYVENKKGVKFYNVPKGLKVLAYDESTNSVKWAEVSNWSEHPKIELEIVNLTNNYQFITDDDPRAVYGVNPHNSDFKLERFTPDNAVKHNVLVPRAKSTSNIFSNSDETTYLELDNSSGYRKYDLNKIKVDENLGYLIGAIVGDGWITTSKRDEKTTGRAQISIADSYGYVSSRVTEIIRTIYPEFLEPTIIEFNKKLNDGRYGNTVRYTYGVSQLARTIKPLIGGDRDETTAGSANKHLPNFSFTANEKFRLGLFAGLMDTDGSISVSKAKKNPQLMANYGSTSLRLIREVKLLASSLGISSRITADKTPLGKDFWMLSFSNKDIQTWGGKYMQSVHKLSNLTSVKKIENSPVLARYDIVPIIESLAMALKKEIGCPKLSKHITDVALINSIRYRQNLYQVLAQSTKNHSKFGTLSRISAKEIINYLGKDKITEFNGGSTFLEIVKNKEVTWERVVSVEKTGIKEDGYDLTVPGFETFMSADGVILSNTLNIHVPALKEAVDDVKNKIMPSKMLYSNKDFESIVPVPVQDLILGIASAKLRKPKAQHVFKSKAEALEAIRKKKISLSDEIIIA